MPNYVEKWFSFKKYILFLRFFLTFFNDKCTGRCEKQEINESGLKAYDISLSVPIVLKPCKVC